MRFAASPKRSRPSCSRISARALVLLVAVLALASPSPSSAGHTASEARKQAGILKNEGVAAFHAGHLAEAITKLSATIDINLNDFFAHYYLGLALRDTHRYAEARPILEVTTQLDPRYLPAYVALGDVALGQGAPAEARSWYQTALNRQGNYSPGLDGMGRLHEALGNGVEAVIMYRRAIEANRGFPDPYVHLGDLFMREDRLDDAITLFREAIRYQPGFAPGYMFLGIAYGKFGKRTEATALLEEAATIEPENPEPHIAMGDLFSDWDDRVQAREEYELARRLGPDRYEPLRGLAELARRDGRHYEAESLMDEALAKPGLSDDTRTDLLVLQTTYRTERMKSVVAYARLELAMADAGDEEGIPGLPEGLANEEEDDDDAIILAYPGIEPEPGAGISALDPQDPQDLQEPLDPQSPQYEVGASPPTTGTAQAAEEAQDTARRRELGYSWLSVARLRHESGDRTGALQACTRSLPNLDRPVDLVSECGFYALEARDWGPARVLMTEAAQRDPTDAHHLVNLGLAYNGLGHMTSAVESYEQALEMNSRSAEAHIYLGNAHYRLGQMAEAEAAYDTSLTLATDPGVLERLQQVLAHLDELRLQREAAAGAAALTKEFENEEGS